ncbi:MAG: histidine phosphatase family protein [Burkholderiales bacterium]|nr:histidine phosphatase family protein [Burkholderiales bacterium]
MELILWRHAEAEDGRPDAERALTKRGKRQARSIAKWLDKRLPRRCVVLVSPAVRAQQTAAALGRRRTTAPEVDVGVAARTVIRRAGWPDAGGTVVVVGHQPTLGRIAARLISGTEADWAIKKGAIWWIEYRAGSGEALLRAVLDPEFV